MNLSKNAKLIIGVSIATGLALAIAKLLSDERSKDFRKKISASLDDFGKRASELLEENREFLTQKGGGHQTSNSPRQKSITT